MNFFFLIIFQFSFFRARKFKNSKAKSPKINGVDKDIKRLKNAQKDKQLKLIAETSGLTNNSKIGNNFKKKIEKNDQKAIKQKSINLEERKLKRIATNFKTTSKIQNKIYNLLTGLI